jgi:hypothetical protein
MLTTVAELKLFNHLSDKIMAGEIQTFSALVEHVHTLNLGFKPDAVLERCFTMLREMRWGFLRELSKSDYPRLWKELVLPHGEYGNAGDLKRNISIANIYIAMLDIHGYTRFCQESKSNLSRLRKLDEFLHEGIRKIARSNSALANRERGDEIVVVASTATDCIKTTVEIISTFSKQAAAAEHATTRGHSDYSIVLPDFKVTAGIAGGNLTTPLIITESGLLSGFLLNTAARLQTLANELSPRDSKVFTTNSVVSSFVKENKVVRSELFGKNILRFFNAGPVSFKGTKVNACEIIFDPKHYYRMSYNKSLETLVESLRQELWKGRVFAEAVELVARVCRAMPPFGVEVSLNGEKRTISNSAVVKLCSEALQLYNREDYLSAVSTLGSIRGQAECIPDFDRLVLRYLTEVEGKFQLLAAELLRRLEAQVEARIDSIFNSQYKTAYRKAKSYLKTYDKLRGLALRSKQLGNCKGIWYSVIEGSKEAVRVEIYSGKR